MKELLHETFGIMVYQEDVIKVCCRYAGLDLADADILRRGMSGKYRQKSKEFDRLTRRFFTGAAALGHDATITKEVWRQISSFAGFSFSKAHSASFAVESYQSLYLKTYFPKEFMVAVLNNYGGFYRRWVYIQELRKTGVNVHLPCVNHSDDVVNIRENEVYLGFIAIQGLENRFIMQIPQERKRNGKYTGMENLIKRVQLTLDQLLILIRVGAMRFTGKTKKELLWEAHACLGHHPKPSAHASLFQLPAKAFQLPGFETDSLEDAYQEMELLGYTVSMPEYELLKTTYRGDIAAGELDKMGGKIVKTVGNLVAEKTVYTRSNTKMWFGTFIDAGGAFFDTVHFPGPHPVYPFRGRGCYLILGKVTLDFGVPSIEVMKFAKLPMKTNPALSM
ncbi:Error-prone DNA polymerase [compost metagenome]